MNSEKREKINKGQDYPKLMVAAHGAAKGSVVLATSRVNETTFKGTALHICGKPYWGIGSVENFADSFFTEYEGELILSN